MLAVVVVIGGLALGGLLNVLVARLPREREMFGWPRCTRCGRRLAIWQLLPLVGWIFQGGRARCCGRRLHWVFPVVEVLCAAALFVFYVRYGLGTAFWFLSFVSAVLLLTAAIDWLHRVIYTLFILLPALICIIVSPWVPGLGLVASLVGAIFAGFAFLILFVLARFLFPSNAVPFGLGDVYLGIFIGAAVGITNLMPALFYGVVAAGVFAAGILLLRRAGRTDMPAYISYGSFLCIGALGYLIVQSLLREA
ncbi:MAG: prepilin peptidase [Roseiflexaceae bacterium]|nr:prepilin peptidase [Roseiflexaceae bacterium]